MGADKMLCHDTIIPNHKLPHFDKQDILSRAWFYLSLSPRMCDREVFVLIQRNDTLQRDLCAWARVYEKHINHSYSWNRSMWQIHTEHGWLIYHFLWSCGILEVCCWSLNSHKEKNDIWLRVIDMSLWQWAEIQCSALVITGHNVFVFLKVNAELQLLLSGLSATFKQINMKWRPVLCWTGWPTEQ